MSYLVSFKSLLTITIPSERHAHKNFNQHGIHRKQHFFFNNLLLIITIVKKCHHTHSHLQIFIILKKVRCSIVAWKMPHIHTHAHIQQKHSIKIIIKKKQHQQIHSHNWRYERRGFFITILYFKVKTPSSVQMMRNFPPWIFFSCVVVVGEGVVRVGGVQSLPTSQTKMHRMSLKLTNLMAVNNNSNRKDCLSG